MDITLSDAQPGPSSSAQPVAVGESASPPDRDNGDGDRPAKRRRTRNGCLPCCKRKKVRPLAPFVPSTSLSGSPGPHLPADPILLPQLCDEVKPACEACERLALTCEWEDKMQAAVERRRKRIERAQEREREREAAAAQAQGALGGSGGVQGVEATLQKGWLQTGESVLLWPTGMKGFEGGLPAVEPVPGAPVLPFYSLVPSK